MDVEKVRELLAPIAVKSDLSVQKAVDFVKANAKVPGAKKTRKTAKKTTKKAETAEESTETAEDKE